LLGFFYRMLDGDRAQAEDLVQETFLRLLRQHTYAPARPFKPWLYAVATNLARDHLRAARSWPAEPGDDVLAALPDRAPGPDQRAVAAAETRRVAAALARLGEDVRVTLVLRYANDLTLADIAAALEVPVGTVKSRLNAGTRRLRELLRSPSSVGQ
ncbi:MAG TPA: sigma-70 family RNA polymerase sigma factor, partial [Candidatus Dormibacteraeota bacterium]